MGFIRRTVSLGRLFSLITIIAFAISCKPKGQHEEMELPPQVTTASQSLNPSGVVSSVVNPTLSILKINGNQVGSNVISIQSSMVIEGECLPSSDDHKVYFYGNHLEHNPTVVDCQNEVYFVSVNVIQGGYFALHALQRENGQDIISNQVILNNQTVIAPTFYDLKIKLTGDVEPVSLKLEVNNNLHNQSNYNLNQIKTFSLEEGSSYEVSYQLPANAQCSLNSTNATGTINSNLMVIVNCEQITTPPPSVGLAITKINNELTPLQNGYVVSDTSVNLEGTCQGTSSVIFWSNALSTNPTQFNCQNNIFSGELLFTTTGWFGIKASQSINGVSQSTDLYTINVDSLSGGNGNGGNNTYYTLKVKYNGADPASLPVTINTNGTLYSQSSYATGEEKSFSLLAGTNYSISYSSSNTCTVSGGSLSGSLNANKQIAISCAPYNPPGPGSTIDLSQTLILSEIGEGLVKHLIDEQAQVGDPKNNQGGSNFSTQYHVNWRADKDYSHRYLNVILDLRKEYQISDLYIYGGNNLIELQTGGPLVDQWTTVGEKQLVFNQWNHIASNNGAGTRYLRLKMKQFGTNNYPTRGSFGFELALYGQAVDNSPAIAIPSPQQLIERPYMEDFIGTNSFIDVPNNQRYIQNNSLSAQFPSITPQGGTEVFSVIRSYSMHQWFEGNDGVNGNLLDYPGEQIEFQLSNSWDFDFYYDYLKNETSNVTNLNYTVYPAIVYTPMHLLQPAIKNHLNNFVSSYNWEWGEAKPIEDPNGNTLLFSDDPSHYQSSAKFYYNLAARYGSNSSISQSNLSLHPSQSSVVGSDKIKHIEMLNETDAWWHHYKPAMDIDGDGNSDTGLLFYWHPYEYAAYLSASYDGDEGRLGNTFGAKNADQNIKVSHNGLAFADMSYPLMVKLWSEQRRDDQSEPFDILNFHHYSNSNGFQGGANQIGVTPEQDKMKEKMEELVDQRNRFFPDKPLWITEFGYDSQREGSGFSPQGVPDLPGYSRQETQGIWVLRAYLAMAAAGVDQACQYMIRDTIPEGSAGDGYAHSLYATSGVTGNYPSYTPKAAYYYLGTFVNVMKGTKFDSIIDPVDQSNLDNDIAIYKFHGNKNGQAKTVYAVWVPGSAGENNKQYNVSLNIGQVNSNQQVSKVELSNTSTSGIVLQNVPVNSGVVNLPVVSESPLFIVIE